MSGGFNNPILGGGGVLQYPAIKSGDFVHNVSGYTINKDGSAEFNNLVIRGTINGTNFVINNSGLFFYNGTPGAGNIPNAWIVSPGVTADPFGNTLPRSPADGGIVSFFAVTSAFAQLLNGSVNVGLSTDQGLGGVHAGGGDLQIISGNLNVSDQGAELDILSAAASPTNAPLIRAPSILAPAAGINSSFSAPNPSQSLAINTIGQLSDLTRDFMLYLTFSGAGNMGLKAGPISPPARVIYPVAAVVAGAAYPVKVPAGWFLQATGTGTVAIAGQNVIGC